MAAKTPFCPQKRFFALFDRKPSNNIIARLYYCKHMDVRCNWSAMAYKIHVFDWMTTSFKRYLGAVLYLCTQSERE